MTIQLPSVFYFQVMRAALRFYKQKVNPTGKQLRVQMTQASRSGEFLERLVDWGLLKVVKDNDDLFDSVYAITAAGGRAAEYGEWDGDSKTWRALPPAPEGAPKAPVKPPQKPVKTGSATPTTRATVKPKEKKS